MNQKKHREYLRKTIFPNWHIWIEEIIKYDYDMILKPISLKHIKGSQEYYCVCCKVPILVTMFECFKDNQVPICQICYTQYIRWLEGKNI